MVADRKSAIKKLAGFLGKDLKDHEIKAIENLSSFEAMKSNPCTNYSSSGK